MNINISHHTEKLLSDLKSQDEFLNRIQDEKVFSLAQYDSWLQQKKIDNASHRFALAKLKQAFMEDIASHFKVDKPIPEFKKPQKGKWYLLLILSGLLYLIQGADSMGGIFSPTLKAWNLLVLAIGMVLSLISFAVFYHFELKEYAKEFGISKKEAPELLDVYLNELSLIKVLYKKIKQKEIVSQEERLSVLSMLLKRMKDLEEEQNKFEAVLNSPELKRKKLKYAIVGAIALGVSGFISGYSAVSSLASIFLASVPMFFWPGLIVGAGVMLVTVAVYWLMQKPDIENFAQTKVGLAPEKLKAFMSDVEEFGKKIENKFEHAQKKKNIKQEKNEQNENVIEIETSHSTAIPAPKDDNLLTNKDNEEKSLRKVDLQDIENKEQNDKVGITDHSINNNSRKDPKTAQQNHYDMTFFARTKNAGIFQEDTKVLRILNY